MARARLDSIEEVSEPPDHQEEPKADLDTIQRELEPSGDVINDLESKLTQAKAQHRQDHATFKERLETMKKKDSSTITKCEPLIKAKIKIVEMQEILNSAVARYDKANSQHSAARELIQIAERHLLTSQNVGGATVDQAWQETLNHATERVIETALDKSRAEQEHRIAADNFAKAHLEYNELWKKLQKCFEKARPYFVEASRCNEILKEQKKVIEDLERKIKEAKASYSGALKALDTLSLLSDEGGTPRNVTPSSQGGMSKSSSTPNVMERVVGELVANTLDIALQSSSDMPTHTHDHLGSPSDPSGHHDNNGLHGSLGNHDNDHSHTPSPLLNNELLIVSHDQSGTLLDHNNASGCSSTTPCPNPASDCPTPSLDQPGCTSYSHDVLMDPHSPHYHDVLMDPHSPHHDDVLMDSHSPQQASDLAPPSPHSLHTPPGDPVLPVQGYTETDDGWFV